MINHRKIEKEAMVKPVSTLIMTKPGRTVLALMPKPEG